MIRTLAEQQPDERVLGQLRATLAEQKRLAKAGDFDEFATADTRFHRTMYEAIVQGELSLAQRTLREHLSNSLAFSSEMRSRFPDYFRG